MIIIMKSRSKAVVYGGGVMLRQLDAFAAMASV